jgi:hypothetical protein
MKRKMTNKSMYDFDPDIDEDDDCVNWEDEIYDD